ncbi:MAG: helix-turn-helix transcriptional regulator [Oscillibacter sp.]|nr:helix-turn-helix transcriptional regulator [Oscillibacter sp.]
MNVNIEAERARKQLTKEALSSALGITSKTYMKYIRGETPIPSDTLINMANLFQCSTDYLLGRTAESSA